MVSSPGGLNPKEIGGLTGKYRELAVGLADTVDAGQEGDKRWEQRRLFAIAASAVDLPERL